MVVQLVKALAMRSWSWIWFWMCAFEVIIF